MQDIHPLQLGVQTAVCLATSSAVATETASLNEASPTIVSIPVNTAQVCDDVLHEYARKSFHLQMPQTNVKYVCGLGIVPVRRLLSNTKNIVDRGVLHDDLRFFHIT